MPEEGAGGRRTPVRDGRSTRWAAHRAARRSELIEAGVEAIRRYGPDVTTEQIASVAGTSRPGIYRHFADREDLDQALKARIVDGLLEHLGAAWSAPGPPYDLVHGFVEAWSGWLADNRELYRNLGRTSGPNLEDDALTTATAAISEQLADLLRNGRLGPPPPENRVLPVAFGLVGLVSASVAHWTVDDGGLSRGALVSELASLCVAVLEQAALRSFGARESVSE